jgi:hypothetical protein
MGFRVSGHDLVSGRPAPPYESRAASEAEAQAEAARLGIRILTLEPIASLGAQDAADEAALAGWNWPSLRWETGRWDLVRLGFEHPRWGKVLAITAMVTAVIARVKLVPVTLAGVITTALVAAGWKADPGLVLLATFASGLFLPLLVVKPWVFRRLRRAHASDGFGRERRLEVRDGEVRWFGGAAERVLEVGEIRQVHELPHSVLIGLRPGHEIVIPKSAFANPAWARRFAERLADASGIVPELGFRSAWMGQRRTQGSSERTILAVMAALLCFLVGLLVLLLLRH